MERSYAANLVLKKIIEKKCVSKAKLAAAAGMRADILSRIVNCKRPIYADEIAPLCNALGIPVNELFSEDGKSA